MEVGAPRGPQMLALELPRPLARAAHAWGCGLHAGPTGGHFLCSCPPRGPVLHPSSPKLPPHAGVPHPASRLPQTCMPWAATARPRRPRVLSWQPLPTRTGRPGPCKGGHFILAPRSPGEDNGLFLGDTESHCCSSWSQLRPEAMAGRPGRVAVLPAARDCGVQSLPGALTFHPGRPARTVEGRTNGGTGAGTVPVSPAPACAVCVSLQEGVWGLHPH